MSTILEADATGTLHLSPSLLPHPAGPESASREAWLLELEGRRACRVTGKSGTPLQEIFDDIRGEGH